MGRLAVACIGLWFLSASGAAAQEPLTLAHQGVSRGYLIHNAETAKSGPMPVVIGLHGNRGLDQPITAEDQLDRPLWRKLNEVATKRGFVTVYPGAIKGQWNYMAGLARPALAGDAVADDVGFIAALVDGLSARKIIDPDRVYLTGFSRGTLLAYEMLCRRADLFAAAFVIAGAMMEGQRDACKPKRPVPLALIAGTNDLALPYDGFLFPKDRLLSVPETMDFWRRQHACAAQTEDRLPESGRSDSKIRLVVWTSCRPRSEVRLYRIEGGGHQVPSEEASPPQWTKNFGIRNHDIESAEELWRFVSTYTR